MQPKRTRPLTRTEAEALYSTKPGMVMRMSRMLTGRERENQIAVRTADASALALLMGSQDLALALAAIDESRLRWKAGWDKGTTEALVMCLTSKTDATVRAKAALVLGQRNDKRSIPTLRTMLSSPDPGTPFQSPRSLQVAFFLARFKDTASYPGIHKLTSQLRDDEQRNLADVLAMMGDPKSVSILRNLLKNSFMGTRAHAAVALGRLRDRASVDLLIALLSDQYADVRRDAAWALAAVGDKRAIPALKKASENPSETIDFKNTRLHLMATALSSQEKENSLRHSRETSRDQVMIRRALAILKNGNAVEIARDWRGNTQ